MKKQSFCDVYLIRHGETSWNIEKRLQGDSDIPLNEEGEKQAMLLNEKLKDIDFSAAFSSDLSRSRNTAKIILEPKTMAIIETKALRERYMGHWEGRLISELKEWIKEKGINLDAMNRTEYLSYKWDECVESYEEIFTRVKKMLTSQARYFLGSSILASSHAGVLRAALYSLDFKDGRRWEVSNCAIVRLRVYENEEMEIVDYSDTKLKKDVFVTF